MINNFIYDIPTKVYFGKNQIEGNLGMELSRFGKKVLLAYGGGSIKKIGLYDKVIAELKDKGFEVFELCGIEPNPKITSVREGVEICKKQDIDVILAVGGGSVIDCAKFVSAGAFYNGDPWDIVLGKVDVQKCIPITTILTLSATGSEMDNVGVISNMQTQDKLAYGCYSMVPKVSFLDPTNTFSVSKYQTACGSADIISHIFEVYFSSDDNMFMLDSFMEGLVKTVVKYAPIAMEEPDNYEARANLMWASSWAINGFIKRGKTNSWPCHAIEHELSAIYDITHGLGLAIVTPRWMKYCLNEKTATRYCSLGVNVFGLDKTLDAMTVAKMCIEKVEDFFFNVLKLNSTLTSIGIGEENIPLMAKKACEGESLDGFVSLDTIAIEKILKECL